MNSQPDLFVRERAQRLQVDATIQEALEDYLDHLCAPLLGVVAYRERCKLRLQALDQLLAIIEEFEAGGMSSQEAMLHAMRQHGEPWQIGRSFAAAWQYAPASHSFACGLQGDRILGFALFGLPAVAVLLWVEQQSWTNTALPAAYLRVLCVIGPIVAGILTGANVTLHPVRAVIRGLLPLILVSMAAGVQLLPDPIGLQLGLFQLLFWLPAGCVAAWLTALFVLSYRRQCFVRTAFRTVRRG